MRSSARLPRSRGTSLDLPSRTPILRCASRQGSGAHAWHQPRSADFHRANTMQKLGVKNIADLVRRMVGE
jgi:hypothetical protein